MERGEKSKSRHGGNMTNSKLVLLRLSDALMLNFILLTFLYVFNFPYYKFLNKETKQTYFAADEAEP